MCSPSLKELPPPLARRTGWPWTEETPQAEETMADGRPWPRITIVTPTYNHERFLEETIRSVLLQGYPNLEYVIVNDGSTDNTAEIIKRYEPFLARSISRSNRGQSYSINEGLDGASPGGWFNWLNSDDILLPGALRTLARVATVAGDAQWIAGAGMLMAEDGSLLDLYCPWRADPQVVGLSIPAFPQDATFIQTDFLRGRGFRCREDLYNVFDTFLYWQLVEVERPVLTTAVFSALRMHPSQKTANVARRTQELRAALEPLGRGRPWLTRLAQRLRRTRLGPVATCLLRLATRYGLTRPSRRWLAVSYNYETYTWELGPARFLVQ